MMISRTAIESVTDLINHDIFQKLSVIKNNNSKMKNQNALNEISNCNDSSPEHCLDPLAKDNKGNKTITIIVRNYNLRFKNF